MESRNREEYNKSPKKTQQLVLSRFMTKKSEYCFLATQAE